MKEVESTKVDDGQW